MWLSKAEIEDTPVYGDTTNGSSVEIPYTFWNYVKNLPVIERTTGRGKHKHTSRCINKIIALDTEATTISTGVSKGGRDFSKDPIAFTYLIQIQFDADWSFIFRTWTEVQDFFGKIVKLLPVDDRGNKVKLVVFVHNLSYEFQFMKHYFDWSNVMAVDSRKILRAQCPGIEFRCSYLQTNSSLYTFTKDMGVKHVKAKSNKYVYDAELKCFRVIPIEEYDYNRARYPWTEIDTHDMHYCMNDVRGLVEAMNVRMGVTKDDLLTLPLTSTGYVRRDMKKVLYPWKKLINDIYPQPKLYYELGDAFRGGNTHGNRHYIGQIVNDVYSYDRSSSYPDVQCNRPFPMTKFVRKKYRSKEASIADYLKMVSDGKYAVIARIKFKNIGLKSDDWGCPYIPVDKVKYGTLQNAVIDNGRVLSADGLEIAITDVDFKIILYEYNFEIEDIYDVWISVYKMLPKPMRDKVIEYYVNKTSLKNIPGKELEYMQAKALLNAIYGMTAQDNLKDGWFYNPKDSQIEKPEYKDDIEKDEAFLQRYSEYEGNAFISYAWGCWTTAWARYELERGIITAVKPVEEGGGGGIFLYTDTDSVKVAGNKDDLEKAFAKLNKSYIKNSTEHGSHATDKHGIEHYTGMYENDAEYLQFVTLGAKKYAAYEKQDIKDDDGKEYKAAQVLEITIAGVGKGIGAEELAELGGLNAFKPGTVFHKAGGTCSTYTEDACCYHPDKNPNHAIVVRSSIAITESSYTLDISESLSELTGLLTAKSAKNKIKIKR